MEVKKLEPRLHFGRLLPLESGQSHWYATVPAGAKLEDVLQPSYWRHYAGQIKADNILRVKCEDGSWAADLWVMFASKIEVKCAIWHYAGLDSTDVGNSATYDVVWKGPSMQFAVIHKGTGEVIKGNLYPKSEAVAFLESHLKSMG